MWSERNINNDKTTFLTYLGIRREEVIICVQLEVVPSWKGHVIWAA